MAWDTETEKYAIHEKWHEKVFRPRGTRAPEFLDKEPIDHYRKRLMTKAAPFVAADLQEVQTEHLYGSALNHYEQRYFESASDLGSASTRWARVAHQIMVSEGKGPWLLVCLKERHSSSLETIANAEGAVIAKGRAAEWLKWTRSRLSRR